MLPSWINVYYIVIAALVPAASFGDEINQDRKLIMVLFDAFRWDYPDVITGMEGFKRLAMEGVRAEYIRPEFPTVSWPNHYSLTTGLHLGDHQVMENRMFDPDSKKVFKWGSPDYDDPMFWDGGEPIWITATRQGKRCRMYYWLGCEVMIRNHTPRFYIKYPGDPGPTTEQLKYGINETLLLMKANKTDFAGFYFDETDEIGHEQEHFTQVFNETMRKADDIITYILDNIRKNNLTESTDVIVFSDHGMTWKDPRKTIWLGKYFNDSTWDESIEWSSIRYSDVMIWPKKGRTRWVYEQLKDKHPHLKVFLKDEIPQDEFWHFKHSKWTPPIFLLADIHWSILGIHHSYRPGGTHGYDNREADMRGIFYATGPDFKKNYTTKHFANVNVYQVMCKILGIEPSPHNGTWETVKDIFVKRKRTSTNVGMGSMAAVGMVLLLFLML